MRGAKRSKPLHFACRFCLVLVLQLQVFASGSVDQCIYLSIYLPTPYSPVYIYGVYSPQMDDLSHFRASSNQAVRAAANTRETSKQQQQQAKRDTIVPAFTSGSQTDGSGRWPITAFGGPMGLGRAKKQKHCSNPEKADGQTTDRSQDDPSAG